MERHEKRNVEELLRCDEYSAAEVAGLLGIGIDVVRSAAFAGDLRATILGHHVIALTRRDVLDWLDRRGRAVHAADDGGG
jgi:hypothetical protein